MQVHPGRRLPALGMIVLSRLCSSVLLTPLLPDWTDTRQVRQASKTGAEALCPILSI